MTTTTETLTEALARHGYTHEPDPWRPPCERGFRIIRNARGVEVGSYRDRSAWALVHALDREHKRTRAGATPQGSGSG